MKNEKFNFLQAIMFLRKYIKKFKKHFWLFYLGWFFNTILTVLIPMLIGVMIDEIVYRQNLSVFLKISTVIIAMVLLSSLLYFLIYAQHHYLMNMFTYQIKMDIFEHFLECKASYLTDSKAGEMIAYLHSYPAECLHFLVRGVIHQINRVIQMIIIVIIAFSIDPYMGSIVLLAALIAAFVTSIFGQKVRKYSNDKRKYYESFVGWIFEMLSGIRDIRLMGGMSLANIKFNKKHKNMYKENNRIAFQNMTAQNIIDFTNLLIMLAIFAYAGYMSVKGVITIGTFTVIMNYYSMLKTHINELNEAHLDSQTRIPYIKRIYDFLEVKTESTWKGTNCLKVSKGDISFNNVDFSYEGEVCIIKKLNLTIKGGEKFALVGKSGCGKTTIAHMLLGYYQMSKGNIIIDEQELTECSLKSIREQIGIVEQEVLLFDGSIKDNLLMGNKRATAQEILQACKDAGIGDFILSLSDGLDTIIGKDGIGLSGGQRQRLAIARIYLKNPKIIIFDESTSALDQETEKDILSAWEGILKNRTAIIIAHRLSSVMLCDQVGIIHEGSIKDVDTPLYMKENNEIFRELFVIE